MDEFVRKGGWVFVSHSHGDIQEVRKLRNALEERGFDPLLFFLKCLEDEKEIHDLIRREIRQRDWFIFVDSENSRNSGWVTAERDYVEEQKDKMVFVCRLDQSLEEQVNRIARRMTVFVSYAFKDRALGERVQNALLERDFLVFDYSSITDHNRWKTSIKSAIDNIRGRGCMLVLLTENSVHNESVMQEVSYALRSGIQVLLVSVGNLPLPMPFRLYQNAVPLSLEAAPSEAQLRQLVENIWNRMRLDGADLTDNLIDQGATDVLLTDVFEIQSGAFRKFARLETVTIPESVAYIAPDAFDAFPEVTVFCKEGSYAERYCKKHGIRHRCPSA